MSGGLYSMDAKDFDKTLDLTKVKPYGDTMNDGKVQLSFTLPVPCGPEAVEAAKQLLKEMGFNNPLVVFYQELTPGYTFFNCYGSTVHTVGIDAIMNLKGYAGHYGIERYDMFEAYNLGSQVPNEDFIAKGLELHADALLVSQTVTQKDVHIKNLTELIELLEAEGLRDKMIVVCGGPRISHELAKELGFDAGFGAGTYADDVASFVAQEFVKRMNTKK